MIDELESRIDEMTARNQKRRDEELARILRQHEDEERLEAQFRPMFRKLFEAEGERAASFRTGQPGAAAPPGQNGDRHFTDDEAKMIRAIWQQARPISDEHTADHLRMILPRGEATITRQEIRSSDTAPLTVRASIETAAKLWGGAHVTGNREAQLVAAAYGKTLGIEVTTEASFTASEIRRAVQGLQAAENAAGQPNESGGPASPEPPPRKHYFRPESAAPG